MSKTRSLAGFTDTEEQVIRALAQGGPSLPSSIARRTGIKRPTVYAVLNKLKLDGLVVTLQRQGHQAFKLVDSSVFKDVLELEAQSKFNAQMQSIAGLASEIDTLEGQQHQLISGFEISTIDRSATVYKELSEAFKNNTRVKAIFNPQIVIQNKMVEEIVLDFLKTSKENGAQVKEIAVAGPKTDWYKRQITNPHHELKILPSDTKVATDFIIGDELLYFLVYDDSEGAGIRIQRSDLLQTMEAVFDTLWEKL